MTWADVELVVLVSAWWAAAWVAHRELWPVVRAWFAAGAERRDH